MEAEDVQFHAQFPGLQASAVNCCVITVFLSWPKAISLYLYLCSHFTLLVL